ncbi:putative butyrate kinase [Bacteroidia bacterium]|nr:putative butyrate kinase [Bacteroidia bacterium]
MHNGYRILTINPGSTSTKIAVFDDSEMLFERILRHSDQELSAIGPVEKQLDFRLGLTLGALEQEGIEVASIDATIGRGGLLRPIPSGVYRVNEAMADELSTNAHGRHASNLGGLIARRIADRTGALALVADPVVVDEMEDVARITGIDHIKRRSVFHALNQKAVARLYADRAGKKYEQLNLVVAHMGGGVSVGAHRRGRVVDVNNALDGEGPLSPERAGSVPAGDLVKMCFSGRYTEAEMTRMLTGGGGFVSLLSTSDMREVERMAAGGDRKAALVHEAMCYNVGKWIGAMAAALAGEVDAIILTGGIAHSEQVCGSIGRMVGFLAPVVAMPGENELEALALNALRVLRGETEPIEY